MWFYPTLNFNNTCEVTFASITGSEKKKVWKNLAQAGFELVHSFGKTWQSLSLTNTCRPSG
jgi:hypothetical protein